MGTPRLRFSLKPVLAGTALFALTLANAWGDPSKGADLFKQNCSMCHSLEAGRNMVGPSLFSVVGRPAATVAGFSYSSAMKSSRVVWTTDELMAYLKAPRKYMPGARMMFSGLADQQDREEIVAFLATLRAAGDGSNAAAAQLKMARASD
jgi:cytochrome c